MNETPSVPSPEAGFTGRYIVTFREGAATEAMTAMRKTAGLGKARMMSSADAGTGGLDLSQLSSGSGAVLDHLGLAVIDVEPGAAGLMAADAGEQSAILAVEPEGTMYALDEAVALSLDYLRGFRDAADAVFERARGAQAGGDTEAAAAGEFTDTATATWGLQATRVLRSRFAGAGVRLAVLDTGLDLKHPDFAGRVIVSRSFVPGVASAQDGHGHGTHCVGTACGPQQPPTGRRYGIAHRAAIYIGKVLSDQGSGSDGQILAGIDWAVANKVQVISMSLGADVPTPSMAYEVAGQRALNAGTLIVAAAGNNARRGAGSRGFVGRPANCTTFMAVAALDPRLAVADFSAADTVHTPGSAVDIAAPGVDVYSTWPLPQRYRSISGTSMATPHVAGIAALWAEASGARGAALWQRLSATARAIPGPSTDVGRGLVQAP